ncbi:MAG TPA: hypothetical protein VIR77_02830, partial [Pontiella sp.]
GMIPFSSITSDWLEADEDLIRVRTRGGKVKFTIGDPVEVELAKVDTARGFVDFVLAGQTVRPQKRERKPRIQPDMKTGKVRRRGNPRRRQR